MLAKKFYSRSQIVLTSALFRLFISFNNLIVSFFVIRLYSPDLWGEIVYYLLPLDLGFVIINWGSSFYLSRQFGLNPQLISNDFQKAFTSRAYLLVAFLIGVLFLPIDTEIKFILIAYSIGRFIYQSFDPIVQYDRNFLFGLGVEAIGILVIVIPLPALSSSVSLFTVLLLFTLSFSIRALITLITFRRFLSGITFKAALSDFLKPSLLFLFLTLTAMLQQRMDLYVATLYLEPEHVAGYQVFLSLLLLSHVAASLLLSPYARNIFRLSHERLKKLERQFILVGVVLSLISITTIFFILKYVFMIRLSSLMYVAGYLYILFYYCYQVRSYQFMKEHRQLDVALFSLTGCVISLILAIFLIPEFGLEGAIASGLSTQIVNVLLHLRVRFDDRKKPVHAASTIA